MLIFNVTAKVTPLRRRWERLCRELSRREVELTIEEFAALLSVYKLLLANGHRFDCGTRALMTVLERQAIDGDDDSDSDGADDGDVDDADGLVDLEDSDGENDDPDADNSDTYLSE